MRDRRLCLAPLRPSGGDRDIWSRNVQQKINPDAGATPVVCVALAGGLGNQMFQFAAGYALARRTGGELRFDLGQYERPNGQDTKRSVLLSCFGISVPACAAPARSASRSGLGRLRARLAAWVGRADTPQAYRQPGFHFDEGFRELRPPVHLSGYFQSEFYFADAASELREIFTIRVPHGPNFARQLAEIRSAEYPVSIHIRRGDYVSEPVTRDYHGVLDELYYEKALALADRLCERRPKYFVFSDEDGLKLPAVMADATQITGNVDRPWEDMALMAACRGHILANSSFSWWGAWLDPKPDKWVVAPRNWFAAKIQRTLSTSDLPCADWIML